MALFNRTYGGLKWCVGRLWQSRQSILQTSSAGGTVVLYFESAVVKMDSVPSFATLFTHEIFCRCSNMR